MQSFLVISRSPILPFLVRGNCLSVNRELDKDGLQVCAILLVDDGAGSLHLVVRTLRGFFVQGVAEHCPAAIGEFANAKLADSQLLWTRGQACYRHTAGDPDMSVLVGQDCVGGERLVKS